jgi:hypothetical protein
MTVLHAKVWEYKGYLLCGATTTTTIEGETIRPTDRQSLGCVTFHTDKFLGVSAEAFELMKTIKNGFDDLSHIDWFITDEGESVFAWLGGLYVILDPKEVEGARYYAVREGMYVPIPNDPPDEAKAAVDRLIAEAAPQKPQWSAEE